MHIADELQLHVTAPDEVCYELGKRLVIIIVMHIADELRQHATAPDEVLYELERV